MDLWICGGAVDAQKFYSAGSMANCKVSSMAEQKLSNLEVSITSGSARVGKRFNPLAVRIVR